MSFNNDNYSAQNVHEQKLSGGDYTPQIIYACGLAYMINPHLFTLQSEETPTADGLEVTNIVDKEMSSQTVSFLDNDAGVDLTLPSSQNTVAMVDSTEDLQLGKFLARPTKIDSFTWSTSDPVGVFSTIKPWYLFLNSPAIKKKIDNFAFIRGHLNIKVLINGTPFQYGALRACYSPLLGFVGDKVRTNLIGNSEVNVPYSQMPGFYIYPQANAGGSMTLRFFLHKNWLDLTSATEIQNMGSLIFSIFSPLQVAVTGGSSNVTVRTYAWMTDVELMGSTSKLALQGDEYGKGVVSAPASAISSYASVLTHIPIIGRFARATEIGASAVSSIAQLFGYTNVPVIADVHAYHPMNAPALSTAHIGAPIQKLALDPKQELSIDPSPHGIGSADDLTVHSIVRRESYLANAIWSTSDATSTQLFNMRVSPSLWQQVNTFNSVVSPVGKRVYHTPLSYCGSMFKHWRGDIIVRVKIVCTKFHKGRIKVCYDPKNDISTINPDENTVYTQIVDIGEEDDLEFVIPYHQDLGWLVHDQTIQDNYSFGSAMAPRAGIDNGLFTITVVNTLCAPASGSINLLVYVRAGDTFEYANPASHIGPDGSNIVPSFFALQAEDTTSLTPTRYVMGKKTEVSDHRYALNYGEAVGSLRNVLHRAMVHDAVPMPSSGSGNYTVVRKSYKRMPYTPGFDPTFNATQASKVVAATGTSAYAFNTMSHIAWVSGMFLGYRGGVNFIVTPSSDAYGYIDDIRVVRCTDSATTNATRFIQAASSTGFSDSNSYKAHWLGRSWFVRDGLGGMAITTTKTNGSIMFNLPDFNNYNFSLVDPSFYTLGSATDGTNRQTALLNILLKRNATGDANLSLSSTLQTEVSAGPDFTCLHFLCCPTIDYLTSEPTPA